MTGSGIERPIRSAIRAAILGGLIALAPAGGGPAWGQSQPQPPQNGPISLLPAPSPPAGQSAPVAPAAPTVTAPIPPSTPPTDNPVQVQQLGNVDFNGFGTLDQSHGGLATTLWANSDPNLLVKALAAVGPSSSRSLQGLIRRVLLSVVTAPGPVAGAKPGDNAFLIARARALWAIGDTDDLILLLKGLPTPALAPPLRRLLADSALLAGDTATACAQTEPLATASTTDPYPVELRVYCQLANGQSAAASLGIDVLREQGVKDPPFFLLADALSIGSAAPKAGVADPSPLILAMSRLAKAEQPMPGPTVEPAVLRAIALTSGTSLEIRLAAGERAEAVGALDTDTLRRLAESVPFTAEDFANAEAKAAKEGPARGRALLLQAVERETAPLAKAGLIAHLLDAVQGPAYFVEARLLGPQMAALQPTVQLNGFAPVLARGLLAARRTDAARIWIGWARAQSATDPSLVDGAARLAVVARLAKLDAAPLSAAAIDAWRKASDSLAGDAAQRRAQLGLALLTALGDTIPPEAEPGQLDGTTLVSAQVPNPLLMINLDTAAQAKRTGETLLLAYLAAGDGSWTRLDVAAIARLVATLKGAGFEDEARAVAIEAALTNGV